MTNPEDQKIIRKVLKDNHSEKYYNETELPQIINTIIINVQNSNNMNGTYDYKTICTFVAQYLHHSKKDNKYYFNVRRKQLKLKTDYEEILHSYSNHNGMNKLTEPVIDEEINLTVVQDNSDGNSSESDSGSKSIPDTENDVNTEEIKLIERQLSKKAVSKFKFKPRYYVFPEEAEFTVTNRSGEKFSPYGTQWIHDEQDDDPYDTIIERRAKQFDILRKIVLPEQRSPDWFSMRNDKITASDIGTVIGDNKYEQPYKFILKKTCGLPFLSNKFCYHGKKFEQCATMVYSYRMNVLVEEFGLLGHTKYSFLGASPDGICSRYKLNGLNESKFVGRMLEIKCPLSRKILHEGEIKGEICPIYYWDQVQLQLECCDLDECDFWQCDIREYDSRNDFIKDTDPDEPFRSNTTGFEKGCIIQLLPKSRMFETETNYWGVVHDDASFIYPEHLEMTPYECDMWVAETLSKIHSDPKYQKYAFDRVIYWKLVDSHNVVINRDREWFAEKLPDFRKMWNYVLFLRENPDKMAILSGYIETRDRKMNEDIMSVIEKLFNKGAKNYDKIVAEIKKEVDMCSSNRILVDTFDKTFNNNDMDGNMDPQFKKTIASYSDTFMF